MDIRKFSPKFKIDSDTGFAAQAKIQGSRLVNKDGSLNIKRVGISFAEQFNFYNELLSLSWSKFTLAVLVFYFITNLIFGFVYYVIGIESLGGALAVSEFEEFLEAFFFSTQTFATVGYGRINPTGILTNLLASIEALLGVMSLALVTSLLYSRFSKPKVKLVFSKNLLVSPFKDQKAMMFRFANASNQQLLECEISLLVSLYVKDNGQELRKFLSLPLERSKAASLALSWTVVHPLNEESPLKDFTLNDYLESRTEFIVNIKGFDNATSQIVYERYSYEATEIVMDAKFTPTFYPSSDGEGTILELHNIGAYAVLYS